MRIEYTETARKQLKKLDKTMQKRILDCMDEVALFENPRRSRGRLLSRICEAYGVIVLGITG